MPRFRIETHFGPSFSNAIITFGFRRIDGCRRCSIISVAASIGDRRLEQQTSDLGLLGHLDIGLLVRRQPVLIRSGRQQQSHTVAVRFVDGGQQWTDPHRSTGVGAMRNGFRLVAGELRRVGRRRTAHLMPYLSLQFTSAPFSIKKERISTCPKSAE